MADASKGLPTEEDFEVRLRAMYLMYAPGKMADVPEMLKRYKGLEEDMFASLRKKYGPEPTPEMDDLITGITDEMERKQQAVPTKHWN